MVYGGGSIKKNGIYDEVVQILQENGKSISEIAGVMPNPTIEKLYEGSGLQDAVLYDENMLYIAKSAATNPPSPFIFVDTVFPEEC